MTQLLADIAAEKELLGGLLLYHDSFTNVHDVLTPEAFYNHEHAALFRAFGTTWEHNEPLDLHTLCRKADIPVTVAAGCMEDAVFGAQRRTALNLVALAQKRLVVQECKAFLSELHDMEPDAVAGRLTQIAISVSHNVAKKVYDAKELCGRVLDMQEARSKETADIRGIVTHLKHLDAVLRGLRVKRMTLLVAATGFGKSTLAMNILHNIALAGTKALLISNENDVDDNLDRLCGIITGIDLKLIESGQLAEKVSRAFIDRFGKRSLYISDNAPRTIHEVIGTMTRYVLQHGVEVVIIDYIGEISGNPDKGETEEQMLARYGQAILDAARSLKCHVILLAQLNRKGNEKGRPTKTELQGCFKLAQKAHAMLIFWQDSDEQDIISIDKNRQGPRNIDIAVQFKRNTQRIQSLGIWNEKSRTVRDLDGSIVGTPNDLPL